MLDLREADAFDVMFQPKPQLGFVKVPVGASTMLCFAFPGLQDWKEVMKSPCRRGSNRIFKMLAS